MFEKGKKALQFIGLAGFVIVLAMISNQDNAQAGSCVCFPNDLSERISMNIADTPETCNLIEERMEGFNCTWRAS